MRLRAKITLPFVLVFVAAYVVTAFVAISLVEGAVERRLVTQTENLARVLEGFHGSSGPMLGHIKRAYAADVIIAEADPFPGAGHPRPAPLVLHPDGRVIAPIGASGRTLVMTYDPAVISREKSDAVRPVALLAVAVLALVVLLGIATASSIARPIERLAEAARGITAGKTDVALPPVGEGEVRDLADALNRMVAAVRAGERLATMGQMAVGVAHEIKNPLSAMKMTVQMLREEQKPEGREAYDVLLREIARLELAASELSAAGPRPLQRERASLARVVDDVLEIMRRQLEHLRIDVARAFEPAPEVDLDVDRFKRVVMNLVLNGAQAMPQGGRLTLGLAPRDGRVRFSVADTGPGIAPELRPRLFEPFVTTKSDGVGLGLALTRRIVEDHGGAIGFDTSERGTTFWVEVPVG
jgi:signal transduction histidine kinase